MLQLLSRSLLLRLTARLTLRSLLRRRRRSLALEPLLLRRRRRSLLRRRRRRSLSLPLLLRRRLGLRGSKIRGASRPASGLGVGVCLSNGGQSTSMRSRPRSALSAQSRPLSPLQAPGGPPHDAAPHDAAPQGSAPQEPALQAPQDPALHTAAALSLWPRGQHDANVCLDAVLMLSWARERMPRSMRTMRMRHPWARLQTDMASGLRPAPPAWRRPWARSAPTPEQHQQPAAPRGWRGSVA